MFSESDMVEFKREFCKSVLKTVVAFANTRGGVVYLGIEDDGTVCGVDDPDAVMLAAMNSIRSSIRPDASMILECDQLQVKGKTIVGIRVERGAKRPYYLADKGMRSEGVYVRQGSASFMASESEIVRMLKESQGERSEDGRSLRQDLTFEGTAAACLAQGCDFGEAQMRTLGLVDEDGQFTNVGLLLSDQCTVTMKLAAFFGTTRTTFKDRLETSGSLLVQFEQALVFLSEHVHYKTKFVDMRRVDYEDFPPDAVREALVNAIVHRDYEVPASNLVSVLDDRVEFVSHGGPPQSCPLDEFQMDVSVPRNPKLAAVFYRLRLIEAYGTGLRRMFEAYEGSGTSPELDISKRVFKVTLPNRNVVALEARPPGGGRRAEGPSERADGPSELRNQERIVLAVLEDQGPLKRSEIQERFDFSRATLLRVLKRLEDKGLVKAEGNTRRRIYRAIANA